MGGKGSGRHQSEATIIKNLSVQKQNPIASGMFLPNYSGVTNHPEFKNKIDDYVPYTGATANLQLGVKNCWAKSFLSIPTLTGLTKYVNITDNDLQFVEWDGGGIAGYYSIFQDNTFGLRIRTDTTGAWPDKILINTSELKVSGAPIISDIATGTAPYQCTSTTLNTNLNADMVDSYHFTGASGSVTADAAELNIMDGVTSTAAELNILDGVTSTAAELNVLDGIPATLTATELGYVDGVTSAIQTQINDHTGDSTDPHGATLTQTTLGVTTINYTGASRARAHETTAHSMINGAWTVVIFDTEDYDNLSEYNTTNGRFTAGANGYYLISAVVRMSSVAWDAGENISIMIRKNGTTLYSGADRLYADAAITKYMTPKITDIIYLGATEYIEIVINHGQGANQNTLGEAAYSWLSIHRLS